VSSSLKSTQLLKRLVFCIPLKVQGIGIDNIYKIKPILNVRIPLNTSFTSLISLHNPHNTTLQILEIYSSDDDLHLEIPAYPFYSNTNSDRSTHGFTIDSGASINMYDMVAELSSDEGFMDTKDTETNYEHDLLEGHYKPFKRRYHLHNLNEKNLWVR